MDKIRAEPGERNLYHLFRNVPHEYVLKFVLNFPSCCFSLALTWLSFTFPKFSLNITQQIELNIDCSQPVLADTPQPRKRLAMT